MLIFRIVILQRRKEIHSFCVTKESKSYCCKKTAERKREREDRQTDRDREKETEQRERERVCVLILNSNLEFDTIWNSVFYNILLC